MKVFKVLGIVVVVLVAVGAAVIATRSNPLGPIAGRELTGELVTPPPTCIERLKLLPCEILDEPRSRRRAVNTILVHENRDTILRQSHVDFDHVHAEADGAVDGNRGVFRHASRIASVGNDLCTGWCLV